MAEESDSRQRYSSYVSQRLKKHRSSDELYRSQQSCLFPCVPFEAARPFSTRSSCASISCIRRTLFLGVKNHTHTYTARPIALSAQALISRPQPQALLGGGISIFVASQHVSEHISHQVGRALWRKSRFSAAAPGRRCVGGTEAQASPYAR